MPALRRLSFSRFGEALLVLVALGVLAASWLRNRAPACCGPGTSLDTPIPLDPEALVDTLDNGLTYYVRANQAPEGRAELRLVVDAGSVLEDDDQRGLAHAVEHMAFRGTTHFPGNAVVNYLQSIGMRSGDDVNASTSYDETIYRLTIPTDGAGTVDTALAVLADWAHEVTFDTAEARREAGVVFEEWRSRTGSANRLREARDSLLLGGTPYAARVPIGDTAVLRRFDVGAMRRFYREWYRPELMAVIAVGDFDAEQVVSLVRKRFGAIPAAPETARPRLRPTYRPADSARAVVLSDPEASSPVVSLYFPRAVSRERVVRDYRTRLVERLSRDLLSNRLDAAAEAADAPLLSASLTFESLARGVEAHVVSATALEGEVPAVASALAAEVARLSTPGVTGNELERAKNVLLDGTRHDEAYADYSDDVADAYVYHYLEGEPFPGREREHQLAMTLLADLGPADVDSFARRLSPDTGLLVLAASRTPLRTLGVPLTAAALLSATRDAVGLAVTERHDSVTALKLIEREPEPGTIVREHYARGPDAFDWLLGNGMRVILKPTRFVADDIELRVVAPGGASLAPWPDYPSAFMSDQVLQAMGVGPLDGPALGHLLGETSVDLSAMVGEHVLQLTGGSAPRDMERLFRLVHLYFTAARTDTALFRRYRERARAFADDRAGDPDAAFEDSLTAALRPGDPRALNTSRAFTQAVDLRRAVDFWRARVANAANFTFVLVGDFSLEGVRPLVTRYLASLPGGHEEAARRIPLAMRPGVIERSFEAGTDPRARTAIVFTGEIDLTPEADATLHALGDVFQLAIEARVREALGGTYGVSVDVRLQPLPRAGYQVQVDFAAAPERVDSLAAAALAEVARMCERGPTEDEAGKVKAAEQRDLESDAESNGSWAGELAFHAQLGWPLESVSVHREVNDRLTAATLRQGCRQFIDVGRYVRLTMRPRRRADVEAKGASSGRPARPEASRLEGGRLDRARRAVENSTQR